MTFDAGALLGLGYAFWVAAVCLHIYSLLKADDYSGKLAIIVQTGGLLLWTAGYVWSILAYEAWRGTDLYGILLLLPVIWVIIALVEERLYGIGLAPTFILSIVLVAGGYALFVLYPLWHAPAGRELAYGSAWSISYYVLSVSAYSALLTAGVWGLIELLRPVLQDRINEYSLMPETSVAGFSRQTILWALILLSATLAVGGWREWLTTGLYWRWTLAEASMLATWALYVAYIHLRHLRGWAIVSVVGMVVVASSLGSLAL